VVRKVLRSGATSFEYEREVQPLPKIARKRCAVPTLTGCARAGRLSS
jgi:hypothetical protein